jgi:hypothetical protein
MKRDGPPWTWRAEVFGEQPAIASTLKRADEWIALMKEARRRFTEAANAQTA